MGKLLIFIVLISVIIIDTIKCQLNSTAIEEVQLVPVPTVPSLVDDRCLHCMCLASSQCQLLSCHLSGLGHYYCGPYLISWAYWADAGKPQNDDNDPFAFEKCLKNKACAELTVQGYMRKYAQDCDSDGQITCIDYARIHKSGPFGCNGTWIDATNYYKNFLRCWLPSKP